LVNDVLGLALKKQRDKVYKKLSCRKETMRLLRGRGVHNTGIPMGFPEELDSLS